MRKETIRKLLRDYKNGRIEEGEILERLGTLPYEDIGFAKVDHHRDLRRGAPEAVFCQGKTPEQAGRIAASVAGRSGNLLATRADRAHYKAVLEHCPEAVYHERARVIVHCRKQPALRGLVAVVSAGTADEPVAEEAAITANFMGSRTEKFYDAGVAGIHRLFDHLAPIRRARAVIVAAGMEGALASVVAGLVASPVVAVPTSVGYGAGFGGLAPLLAMLNSCAGGVSVVNIDNGFGAGYVAHLINRGATNRRPVSGR